VRYEISDTLKGRLDLIEGGDNRRKAFQTLCPSDEIAYAVARWEDSYESRLDMRIKYGNLAQKLLFLPRADEEYDSGIKKTIESMNWVGISDFDYRRFTIAGRNRKARKLDVLLTVLGGVGGHLLGLNDPCSMASAAFIGRTVSRMPYSIELGLDMLELDLIARATDFYLQCYGNVDPFEFNYVTCEGLGEFGVSLAKLRGSIRK